ncbi:MAG: class I SAM-dependent methyltransferase [Salinivirgaceae bacterium]|jgi:predicted O-methyltransferase YrrM|nr:class I SAM-dependent methyltransferase [Salinivirgaceae bacterium]
MLTTEKIAHFSHSFRHGLSYYLFSKHGKGFGIHSPFAYKLISETFLPAQTDRLLLQTINQLYKTLASAKAKIKNNSNGSRVRTKSNLTTVGKLNKTSSLKPKYIALLSKLIEKHNLTRILELGTCCGVTSTCLASINNKNKITTIEKDVDRAHRARYEFEKCGLQNVQLLETDFNSGISALKKEKAGFDLIFIDGDHSYEGTLAYYHQLKDMVSENGVMVFDDIYWSKGMTKAWRTICNEQDKGITIDIFQMGLLFIRPQQAKEHFTIRF